MTGTRPRAALMMVSSANAHSSSSIVLGSPVVPQATRAAIPLSICQLTRLMSAATSMPSLSNGVTRAVQAPVKIGVLMLKSSYSLCRI